MHLPLTMAVGKYLATSWTADLICFIFHLAKLKATFEAVENREEEEEEEERTNH